jgi:hypothetical protein
MDHVLRPKPTPYGGLGTGRQLSVAGAAPRISTAMQRTLKVVATALALTLLAGPAAAWASGANIRKTFLRQPAAGPS